MAAVISIASPFPGFSPTLVQTSASDRTINISATNSNPFPVAVSVNVSTIAGAVPIEYNTIIPGYGTYERGGVVIPSGSNSVSVSSTASNVQFIAYGYTP